MPVFADVLPEPSIGYPFEVYTSSSSMASDLFYSLLRIGLTVGLIIGTALFIFWIICLRRIFRKAGLHGRGSLIPVYREYLRFKMVGWNGRWTASLVCPAILIIVVIISYFKAAEKFGKDKEQFGMGLWFLHPVFLGILAFDKSKYQK